MRGEDLDAADVAHASTRVPTSTPRRREVAPSKASEETRRRSEIKQRERRQSKGDDEHGKPQKNMDVTRDILCC